MKKAGFICTFVFCVSWILAQPGHRTEIPLTPQEEARDIQLKFQTNSNLKAEEWATIQFLSAGELKSARIFAWDPDSKNFNPDGSRELSLENVPGSIDRIILTLRLHTDGVPEPDGTIFVNNLVLLDPTSIQPQRGEVAMAGGN